MATLLALALLATPEIRVEGGVPAEAAAVAAAAWERIEQLTGAEGLAAPASPTPIRIGTASILPPAVASTSHPGQILLREGLASRGAAAAALRHEMAHQFLFQVCAAASADRLFHEAFAIATSGEVVDWGREDGTYLSLAKALRDLSRAPSLDSRSSRRALARLLSEAPVPARGRLPPALSRRFPACEAGARWNPLRPEDLASDLAPTADALVVISRHSGEVIRSAGAAALPMPFGSTLKPFLIAGAPGPTPVLTARRGQGAWRCGAAMPNRMDAATALLRSCNGWFLDWAARDPRVVTFGKWGPALLALGLSGTSSDASEAIGIRP
ncbi:MAG TPA: hypothetical protein VMK12_22445, partial [Anaeromyxobacteraceae bacterium]|nr:hypothetical protein [Anaeromyxobacteraceae bacterium]